MIFGQYCNASAKCGDWISSLPAKSAMVRDSIENAVMDACRKTQLTHTQNEVAARNRLLPSDCNRHNYPTSPMRMSEVQMISGDWENQLF
jgi:hypothetical protein